MMGVAVPMQIPGQTTLSTMCTYPVLLFPCCLLETEVTINGENSSFACQHQCFALVTWASTPYRQGLFFLIFTVICKEINIAGTCVLMSDLPTVQPEWDDIKKNKTWF